MKSRIVSAYDYKQAEIPAELGLWRVRDEEIAAKLETLSHDHAYETEPETVERFDSVACSGESTISRWNRTSLRFYPGRRLCDAAIEDALIGAKPGETRSVTTEEGDIALTVTRVIRRVNMPVSDELVQAENIEGVMTVADYERWYRDQNEPERRINATFRMAYHLIEAMMEKSEFAFDENEKHDFLAEQVDIIYDAMVQAGVDPTIPKEGFDFLTEEQAKANMIADFAPRFTEYVTCAHLVELLAGVDAEALCEETLPRLAAENNMTAEALLEGSGKSMCYGKILQDKALELLVPYVEQFLEA